MKNKKVFNNLFDSICITVLLFICLTFYLIIIWFGVINCKEGTNPTVTFVISTLVFVIMMVIIIILLINGCFGYWILSKDSIFSKRLFRKKIEIKFTEIKKVEKRIVPAIVLGLYKSEAYIVYSDIDKITILISGRKKYYELDSKLAKFIE